MSPQDSVHTVFVPDELRAVLKDAQLASPDLALAMKVPSFKRAYEVTCGVLARLPWVEYEDSGERDADGRPIGTRLPEQPRWLTTSDSGMSPRDLRWGVAGDQFASGIAAIGFTMKGEQPHDALHVPRSLWSLDGQKLMVNTAIPEQYRQKVILLPLGYGSNGMLIDAAETITDANDISAAYRDRIKNPIAQTILTLAADRWDGWDETEREQFRTLWVTGRKSENGSTAMKPDWVEVDVSGQLPSDLFESGRNANRLDMANSAGMPASILEGAKQGGGSGDMHYSTEAGGATRNELWDYGLAKYADATDGRLSLDDVCPSGHFIQADASRFLATPNPTDPQPSED